MAAAAEQVTQILTLTEFDGSRILDLCCGPGRHSAEFARRGFRVTGVDLSPHLITHARSRAAGLGVSVEWVLADMRNFQRADTFELACNLSTSFGYFEDEDDNLKVIQNVYQSLVTGGVFLIELAGKEILARRWQNAFCSDFDDGSILIQRSWITDDWCAVDNEWIVVRENISRRFRYKHHLYSGKELKDLLLRAGFTQVRLYGSFDGDPYALDAVRLIAVARKSASSISHQQHEI